MTYKEKLAKKKAMFSTSSYLKNKAVNRVNKLQYRAAKKTHQHDEHVHEHTEDCNHENEVIITDETNSQTSEQNA
jgi:hypothetical protein